MALTACGGRGASGTQRRQCPVDNRGYTSAVSQQPELNKLLRKANSVLGATLETPGAVRRGGGDEDAGRSLSLYNLSQDRGGRR